MADQASVAISGAAEPLVVGGSIGEQAQRTRSSDVEQRDRSIAVVLTSHNRREGTLAAIGAVEQQRSRIPASLKVFLVDAGSSDGTVDAIVAMFPDACVLRGDDWLYWSGGMRRGLGEASKMNFDYYLWLNDDTLLYPDAIQRLLECCEEFGMSEGVTVGSTQDAVTGVRSYGGLRLERSFLRPFNLVPVAISSYAEKIDTMNGNIVLVPKKVRDLLGDHDSIFTHAMADVDYGLRARAAGVDVWLAPGYHGTCSLRDAAGTWKDTRLGLGARMRLLHEPKGLPPREWQVLLRRHCGRIWLLPMAAPYCRIFITHLRRMVGELSR